MEYKIVEKKQFTVIGKSQPFNADTSYTEIPVFWEEHLKTGGAICGMYGICLDMDGKKFEYLIADNYIPWGGSTGGLCDQSDSSGHVGGIPVPRLAQNASGYQYKDLERVAAILQIV